MRACTSTGGTDITRSRTAVRKKIAAPPTELATRTAQLVGQPLWVSSRTKNASEISTGGEGKDARRRSPSTFCGASRFTSCYAPGPCSSHGRSPLLRAGHKTNAQFWRTRVTMAPASVLSERALARVSGDGDSDRLGNDCLHGNLTRWTLDDGPTNNVDKWLHTQNKRCRALACK